MHKTPLIVSELVRHLIVLNVTNEKSIHHPPHHSPMRTYVLVPTLSPPYAFADPLPLWAYVLDGCS